MSITIDLHVHTHYSGCSNLNPDRIEQLALERGLNTIAICDHNCIEGALETAALAKFITVIIAEEIVTTHGEIIGYFLNEHIPPGLSPNETVSEIKRQGGLASVPHPFDRLRSSRLHISALKQVIDSIDMIEVFNARNMFNRPDRKLLNQTRKLGVVPVVSSDAHLSCEIGRATMVMDNYQNPEDFLAKLRNARCFTRKSPLWVHAATKLIRMRRKAPKCAIKPPAAPGCS